MLLTLSLYKCIVTVYTTKVKTIYGFSKSCANGREQALLGGVFLCNYSEAWQNIGASFVTHNMYTSFYGFSETSENWRDVCKQFTSNLQTISYRDTPGFCIVKVYTEILAGYSNCEGSRDRSICIRRCSNFSSNPCDRCPLYGFVTKYAPSLVQRQLDNLQAMQSNLILLHCIQVYIYIYIYMNIFTYIYIYLHI